MLVMLQSLLLVCRTFIITVHYLMLLAVIICFKASVYSNKVKKGTYI